MIHSLLIANRGEIAVRIARAAADLGIRAVAVHSQDDAASLHVRKADAAYPLPARGPAAYLDIERILAVAKEAGCDAVHPGYGFLSENPAFARRCAEEGLRFVGPRPDLLALLGDKARARQMAARCGVPIPAGTMAATTLEEARDFLRGLGAGGAIMIKALAGGGGRGIRVVRSDAEIGDSFARCQSEARAAFGSGEVYVEQLIAQARHVEVQIAGDGSGRVVHLWERECTLQRRHQKLVEVAPSPSLPAALRERLLAAAVRLAGEARYESLGTFEFLVDAADPATSTFVFIEANPRLQVEHTVTEEVLGLDLVAIQLRLAAGATLDDLGLRQERVPEPRGHAMQLRINLEQMDADGHAAPSGGRLTVFEPPAGRGIRVDSFGYAGYTTNPSFDSLLAKLIVHGSEDFDHVVARAYRALCEFRIEGVGTNVGFLQNVLRHPDVRANRIHTRFLEERIGELVAPAGEHPIRFFSDAGPDAGKEVRAAAVAPPGTVAVPAPMQSTIVTIDVSEGDSVRRGQRIAVLEAMKMEHLVVAGTDGVIRRVEAAPGDTVLAGQPLFFVEPAEHGGRHEDTDDAALDLDAVRPDLAEMIARHAMNMDEGRPDAVARRHKSGQRTARENIADLCDPGSFIEYGALALAAQRRRRSIEDLLKMSPADGLVTGIGAVNGAHVPPEAARCMVMAYDYTVFAGTQGFMNHKKTDRMVALAEQWRLPVVLFAEGGGGRPGETDVMGLAGLDLTTFAHFARLSGLVPLVGIVSGRCFAGNAALLGCSDVIIATENATIGMGGPAMIEGGGLGVYAPEEVGPVAMQAPSGVIDVVVPDEAAAVRVAKQYLSFFQGPRQAWECADQRMLRHLIPENRRRSYDVRQVIATLADMDSVLELRERFGVGIITALIRIEGRPMGLIANNPQHLGGAIDADAADKAARFMQLCDAFDLPIVSLCDTPGFMVGPDMERRAQVRHVCRMFVTAASLTVPFFTVVLRKGYGLGAQAMAAGSFHAPFFTVAWPTGEFGGMGLEGAVRLGYRRELEAIADPAERQAAFENMVAEAYAKGKALNMASYLEIDGVIDPLESRRWILRGLAAVPPSARPAGKKRPFVDTW